ncbi:ABC transporter substrate-binding protein [Marivibrio halodurans]|uniref:ABC transporter substrate-binding protein n=1 Tax=Marivibrio halodurans TaxID=2039722 RepID=A0A8J7V231_9PROT|nr:ABC transporter substrate-binding protein [Marivibrio halodurans]MBP5856437.1 ABC transporter substrate-binding protein [Marivibrio halodurans]
MRGSGNGTGVGSNRGPNRRRVLTGAAAAAAGFYAGPMLWTAGRARAATPKAGGHMTFGVSAGSTSDTFDPGKVGNAFESVMQYTVGSMLTEIDADGGVQPKLATGWDSSADATRWTFELRKDAVFHDGRKVTSEDVIASLNHHRGEKSESTAKPIMAAVEDISADGPSTVVVALSAADADFPFKLSSFNFPIYPANADGTMDWQSRNGCGPYRVTAFDAGVRAEFERHPDYFARGPRAHFDSVSLLCLSDTAARQNALMTGEVDAIDRVDLATFDLLAKATGITVEEVPNKTHYTFPMRTDTAPFTDLNVRLALKHAVDREALLKTILRGHGVIGNDTPINSTYRYYSDEVPQRTYDPDRARHYLKKAGHEGLALDLHASDAAFTRAVDASVLLAENAKAAGFDISVKRAAQDGYWNDVWMKVPWSACYWYGTPTEDGIFTTAYSAGADWNDTFWDNERFNELLVAARGELDEALRAEMYHEMQLILNEDGGLIAPVFANDVFATRDGIAHGPLANNFEVDGRLFFERWWREDA